MRVPNAEAARVDRTKVVEYLLSETHPVGRGKATFFMGLGFAVDMPEELVAALLEVVRSEEVVEQRASDHGTIYAVDGPVGGQQGSARTRTVWVMETGESAPRLVTAYPAPGEGE